MKFWTTALKNGSIPAAVLAFTFCTQMQVGAADKKSAPLPGSSSTRYSTAPVPGAPLPASSPSPSLPAVSSPPAHHSLRLPSKDEPVKETLPSTRISPETDKAALSTPMESRDSAASSATADGLASPSNGFDSRSSSKTDEPAAGGHTPLLNCSISEQAEQVQWTAWHKTFHQAVMENQAALLKQNKSIHYGFAVVEFTVTSDKHINVRVLPHNDPTFLRLADEAFSNYHMKSVRKAVFLEPNRKFDDLVVRCYERLDGKTILEFPANSARKEVSDTRWHLAGAGVGNYVRWRTDDYEQITAGDDAQASGGENTASTNHQNLRGTDGN